MNIWLVLGIIVMVLGVIASNIMLLKYSAKFKMPKAYTPPEVPHDKKTDNAPPPSDKSVGE
ncbi:DUF2897 family protein [Alteromonas lipolytica]|uniref:DUF2897 domain-containing protein n=1 Tax=Alteromonas lipolytica TaxID=1856405 RepID=A0A1E8FKN8_9ALTE|nr:DUF2897 family protein [Alteromonas lipolytica]OFI36326.1 hypothetical protein BFC17_00145 [Alteromonas lipolytica]GGF70809.1 hypothetical protein GCM10011338_23720 [Alteromonas lipolytica]